MDKDFIIAQIVQVLYMILPIVLPIVVHRAAQEVVKFYRAKTTEEQRRTIEAYARQAVLFAEQTGLKDAAIRTGQEKKSLALQYLQSALLTKGIPFNVAWLDQLIESTVYTELTQWKPDSAPNRAAAAAGVALDTAAVRLDKDGHVSPATCDHCPHR